MAPWRKIGRGLAYALAVVLVLVFAGSAASWAYTKADARKAAMTTSGPYRAGLGSLGEHPVPP